MSLFRKTSKQRREDAHPAGRQLLDDLILALNAAAAVTRQAAFNEEAVLQTAMEQLARLNLRGGIAMLNDAGDALTIRGVGGTIMKVVAVLEQLTGLSVRGYSFPVSRVDAYRKVIESREARYFPHSDEIIRQIVPDAARPLVNRILFALGNDPAILAPLLASGKLLGLLSTVGPDLQPEDLPAVVAFADHIAQAIAHARLLDETRRRAEELQTLVQVNQAVTSTLDPETILERVLDEAMRVAHATKGFMIVYEPNLDRLIPRALRGFSPPELERARAMRMQVTAGLNGLAFRTQQIVSVDDVRASPDYFQFDPETRAELVVPMLRGGKIVGNIDLQSKTIGAFRQVNLALLKAIANQAEVALENAGLFRQAEQQLAEMSLLFQVTQLVQTVQDVPALLPLILDQVIQVMGARAGTLFLREGAAPRVRTVAARGHLAPAEGFVIPFGEGLAGRVMMSGKAIVTEDLATDARLLRPELFRDLHAGICVPLATADGLIGAILIAYADARVISPAQVELLSTIAATAAGGLQRARLFDETRVAASQFGLLYDAGLVLNSVLEPRVMIKYLLQIANQAVRAERATFYRYDPRDQILRNESAFGLEEFVNLEALQATTFPLGEERGLVGKVAAERAPLYLADTADDPRWIDFDGVTRCAYWTPVQRENQLLGVLVLISTRVNAFSPADQRLIGLFANQLAVALENARLFAETKRRAHQQEALYQISVQLARVRGMQELCETVIRAGREILGYAYLGIFLLDPETGDRVLQGQSGWDEVPGDWRIPPGAGLSDDAVRTGALQYWRDVTREPRYLPGLRNSHSELDVPIRIGDQVLGVLIVEDTRVDAFSQTDIETLQAVANQLAVALENARLFQAERQREEILRELLDISLAANAGVKLRGTLKQIALHTAQACRTDRCTIYLLDETGAYLHALMSQFADGHSEPALWEHFQRMVAEPLAQVPLLSAVIREQKPAVMDLQSPTHTMPPRWTETFHLIKLFAVPLIRRGKPIGVLVLDTQDTAHEFSAAQIELAMTIGAQVSAAIENARLFEAERAAREQAETLREVAQSIGSALELDAVLRLILEQLKRVLSYDTASILLFEEGDQPNLVSGIGYADERKTSQAAGDLLKPSPILRQMAHDKKPVIISDVREHPGWIWVPGAEQVRAFLAAPVVAQGKMIGALMMDKAQPDFFKESDARIAQALAQHIAVALQNARLFESLHAREAQYRELVESVQAVVWRADALTFQFSFVSHEAEKLLGYPVERWLTEPTFWKDHIHPDDRDRAVEYCVAMTRGKTPHQFEYRMLAADGKIVWVRDIVRVIVENEQPRELVGVLIDITERKQREQDLQQRMNELHVLHTIAAASVNARTEDELIERATQVIGETLYSDNFGILLLDETGKNLRIHSSYRGLSEEEKRAPIPLGHGVTGAVAQKGIARRLANVTQDPDFFQVGSPMLSELCAPLLGRYGVLGVVNAETARLDAFTENDERILSIIAAQLATGIEKIRLLEETNRRAEQLALLYDAGLTLNRVIDLRTQIKFLLEIAKKALRADRADFFKLDPARNELTLEVGLGYSPETLERLREKHFQIDQEESLVGWVGKHRSPVNPPDLSKEPRYRRIDPEIRSGIWIPIEHESKLLGVLTVKSTRPNAFTPHDERLLILFANQAAVAMENARLFEETNRRAAQLASLNEIGRVVSMRLDIESVLETIYQQVRKILPLDAFYVCLYDSETGRLHYPLLYDDGKRYDEPSTVMKPLTNLARTIQTGTPLLQNRSQAEMLESASRQFTLGDTSRVSASLLFAPLMVETRVIGALSAQAYTMNAYTAEHLALLTGVANQAAVALENARLFAATQNYAHDLEGLHTVAQGFQQVTDLPTLYARVTESIARLLRTEQCAVILFDEAAQAFMMQTPAFGITEEQARAFRVPLADSERYWAAMTPSQPYVIVNAPARDARVTPQFIETFRERSLLTARLWVDDKLVGAIRVANKTDAAGFTDRDGQILSTIAPTIAIAIQNARLFDSEETRRAELGTLYDLSRELADTNDFDAILALVTRAAIETIHITLARAALIEGDEFVLRALHPARALDETTLATREPVSAHPFCQRALLQNAPSVVRAEDPAIADSERAILFPANSQTLCFVPIRAGERALGLLLLNEARGEAREPFSPEKIRLARSIGEQAASALERARFFSETRQRLAELETLNRVSATMRTTENSAQVQTLLLETMTNLLHTPHSTLLLLDPDQQNFTVVLVQGTDAESTFSVPTRGRQIPVAHGITGLVLKTGEPYVTDDFENDPQRAHLIGKTGIGPAVIVLLRTTDRAVGTLLLGRNFGAPKFTADEVRLAQTLAEMWGNALHRFQLHESLEEAYLQTVLALANAVDAKDHYTAGHAERLTEMALAIGRALGFSPRELEDLRYGAILHDIGKIGVADSILKKPGKLDAAEWVEMRRHPEIGAQILAPIPRLAGATQIVRHHHERFDGMGYPDRVAGEKIPLGARILTVVDAFSAITDARVYKPARPQSDAISELQKYAGTQFDPHVVEIFLSISHLA